MEVFGETKRVGGSAPQKAPALLVRASEAAQMLALSPRKLWELTNRGEVPCVRIGRSVRYSVEDLRRLVDAWRQG